MSYIGVFLSAIDIHLQTTRKASKILYREICLVILSNVVVDENLDRKLSDYSLQTRPNTIFVVSSYGLSKMTSKTIKILTK